MRRINKNILLHNGVWSALIRPSLFLLDYVKNDKKREFSEILKNIKYLIAKVRAISGLYLKKYIYKLPERPFE